MPSTSATGSELCAKLGIDRQQLEAWVKEGLPALGTKRSRSFDPAAVAAWLVARGYAQSSAAAPPPGSSAPADQATAATRADVARHFNVSERTVATWIREGMPGRVGRPGTREGFFPLGDIEAWYAGRTLGTQSAVDETKHQAQAKLASVRAELISLDLAKARGQVADVTELTRRLMRAIHNAKALASQLEPRLIKCLPGKTSLEVKRAARAQIKRTLDEFYANMAAAFARLAEEDPKEPHG